LPPWQHHRGGATMLAMSASAESISQRSTASARLRKGTKDDARALLRTPFALTRSIRTPESGVRRLRVRDDAGLREWRFDLMMNVRRFADGDTVADNYSAAVVELPERFDGRIGFARRGFLRHPVVPDLPVAAVGSPALARRYAVRTSSPELLAAVLTDPVLDWLCGDGGSFHYELVHNRVLAYGWRRYVGGNALLRAAEGFRASVASGA
jgi:hypothetical protein